MIGGIISIFFMILLGVTFHNRIVDTLNRKVINASIDTIHLDNPSSFSISNANNNFMFGV